MNKKSVGKTFMEETKYPNMVEESDKMKELPMPPLEKEYTGEGALIDLPEVKDIEVAKVDLTVAINQRESHRTFIDKSLTKEELSYLLWTTAGVKKVYKDRVTLRTVPSAGASHPFETYLWINNVDGLDSGIYRYLSLSHQLLPVSITDDLSEEMVRGCLGQEFVSDAAVLFIWVAIPYRTSWKYQERGYRYLHLDAGHVCQNLYLSAIAVNSGTCAIGAYDDDYMNQLLELDGEEEFVVYLAPVGKIK